MMQEMLDFAYAPKPEGFKEATQVLGAMQQLAGLLAGPPPELIRSGLVSSREADAATATARILVDWMTAFHAVLTDPGDR